MFDTAAQADRLRALVRGAEGTRLPEFAGNARTDVFLFGVREADARTPRRRARARRFARSWLDEFEVGPHGGGATGPGEGCVAANVIAEGL